MLLLPGCVTYGTVEHPLVLHENEKIRLLAEAAFSPGTEPIYLTAGAFVDSRLSPNGEDIRAFSLTQLKANYPRIDWEVQKYVIVRDKAVRIVFDNVNWKTIDDKGEPAAIALSAYFNCNPYAEERSITQTDVRTTSNTVTNSRSSQKNQTVSASFEAKSGTTTGKASFESSIKNSQQWSAINRAEVVTTLSIGSVLQLNSLSVKIIEKDSLRRQRIYEVAGDAVADTRLLAIYRLPRTKKNKKAYFGNWGQVADKSTRTFLQSAEVKTTSWTVFDSQYDIKFPTKEICVKTKQAFVEGSGDVNVLKAALDAETRRQKEATDE